MRPIPQRIVAVTQDNYGRWFVEAREGGRKLAPIRCLGETAARDLAERLARTLPPEAA